MESRKKQVVNKGKGTSRASDRGRLWSGPSRPPAIPTHPLRAHTTLDLESSGGQLDAKLIANAFGLSEKEIAALLSLSIRELRDNPAAKVLQEKLQDFQRIARLRMLANVSPTFFKRWLRSPVPALKSATPLDMLRLGKGALVAELVENAVTSQPS